MIRSARGTAHRTENGLYKTNGGVGGLQQGDDFEKTNTPLSRGGQICMQLLGFPGFVLDLVKNIGLEILQDNCHVTQLRPV